ncbi:MAG: 2-C-methyl-D-erythritol 4-phosphate cytidylyltransferase [Nitrospirae bacterium]|nr:2-C-methyl-D-erythritol 4-phosphate cytidylyltransferase [Nitrospirota bacterium]
MQTVAIVPAAGLGRRMGGSRKPFLEIGGVPVIVHSLRLLQSIDSIIEIIPAVRPDDMPGIRAMIEQYQITKAVRIAPGGAERQDSIFNALQLVDCNVCGIVLVHDAVRPFADAAMVMRLIDAAAEGFGAIPGVPLKDTVKIVGKGNFVESTPSREKLVAVQTPQAFPCDMLKRAYECAMADGVYATDDAALVERIGGRVVVVPGSYDNIKITTPEDLGIAEIIWRGIHGGA